MKVPDLIIKTNRGA